MIIEIPGAGTINLEHIVFDYNGTIARDGLLLSNIDKTLAELSERFTVHILTADTGGTAREELEGLPCTIHVISRGAEAEQKEAYVQALNPDHVVSIGNGANDRLMLKTARIGIAVLEGEGSAASAILNADIVTRSIYDALGMLMIPQRLVATLRS